MGLQITIFVSVLFFTSLVPHRKKNSGICSMVPTTPDGAPPCPLCEPIHCCHPSHRVSLYRMPDRRRPTLGKMISGAITTTYCEQAGSRRPGPPDRPCGYCMGFTKVPPPDLPRGMWLSHGSDRLDVVGYDRHINDDYHNDRREY